MEKTPTHDRLQQECFNYLWNTYPQTRKLCFHPMNEIKPYPGESKESHIKRIMRAKSIGVVKGVLDLIFYWRVLHVFDIKMPGDSLSPDQLEFIAQVLKQGGTFTEINVFEDFKQAVDKIMT